MFKKCIWLSAKNSGFTPPLSVASMVTKAPFTKRFKSGRSCNWRAVNYDEPVTVIASSFTRRGGSTVLVYHFCGNSLPSTTKDAWSVRDSVKISNTIWSPKPQYKPSAICYSDITDHERLLNRSWTTLCEQRSTVFILYIWCTIIDCFQYWLHK